MVDTFSVPRYDLAATGQLLEGPEAVAKRVVDLAAANPGVRIEAVSLRHADDAVIVETRTRGLHQIDPFGMAPTGKPNDVRGVALFVFDGDRLVNEIVYHDRLTGLEQVTGVRELPAD